MIKINNPADCCGCSACASICGQNAIKMVPDGMGFLYPEVDTSRCVDCGLCEKVCSFNDNYDISLNLPSPISYGARQTDVEEVMRSRSGAVFAALSDFVLKNGGVIYGAGYDDHFRVIHKRAVTKEERDGFRGSKYVQSDMGLTFRKVLKDLKEGTTVLFSGTPCQTAGLNSYVGERYRKNLILVDLVCHGVPSPYIWRDYISHVETEEGAAVTGVDFRNKHQFGWTAHKESFVIGGIDVPRTWYSKTFYQHIMFRHSCENCHFCNTKRPSDITIADFWGWQKQNRDINADDKGVNLVLVNSVKGQELFEAIKERLQVINATPDAYMQPNLMTPSKIHRKRHQFERDYIRKGFDYIYTHNYPERPLWRRVLSKIFNTLKRIIRK